MVLFDLKLLFASFYGFCSFLGCKNNYSWNPNMLQSIIRALNIYLENFNINYQFDVSRLKISYKFDGFFTGDRN